MAVQTVDINKRTIMEMLRTDVFGFSAEDIEEKAKEVHHLVGGALPNTIDGYLRSAKGYIQLSAVGPKKGKKKK